MDDALTQLVLDYQSGRLTLERVRDPILLEAFAHLRRYRRKGEDEVSEFLLAFHLRVQGLVDRFRYRGLPFRHYLLRCLRWQWNTFRAERAQDRRRSVLVADQGLGMPDSFLLAEPSVEWTTTVTLSDACRKRLVLLVLKAAPYLELDHLELLSHETGADLVWLQACQYRLRASTEVRRRRRAGLVDKRGLAFYRRLMAEDEARREPDPLRRSVHEHRAALYRTRLVNLSRQQDSTSVAPTHAEVARLLGAPKGSVDSGLHHLKKELASVYNSAHDDSVGHEQRP